MIWTGAGESGKSTVVKQLKNIYKVEMDDQELNNYRENLHNNTVSSMQTFLEAADNLNIGPWENEDEAVCPSPSVSSDLISISSSMAFHDDVFDLTFYCRRTHSW